MFSGGGAIGLLYHSYVNGIDFSEYYAQHIDAAMVIKYETTLSHLWLEEILSGDRHESIDSVRHHLGRSEWYTQAMLSGGTNEEGYFLPIRESQIRDQLRIIQNKLKAFRIALEKRFVQQDESFSGSMIDQMFDRLFIDILRKADRVESMLRQQLKEATVSYRQMQFMVLVLLLLTWLFSYWVLKRFNRQLVVEKEQARAADLAKSDFLASMSHELRTPLTTIIGHSEYLIEQLGEAEQRALIRAIEVAGKNQLALVNDLLDMSKIESGQFTIDDSPYDLAHLIEEVRQMFATRISAKELEFEVVQSEVPKFQLLGDHQRVKQILVNLIGNAIKFTEQGKISFRVWISADRLYFSVSDSGIGISPDILERLFSRFEQADNSISRRFGGSGLGLFISRNLAELMGGSIAVESQVGSGSTFQLNLPCQLSQLPRLTGGQEQDFRHQVMVSHYSGVVLVAEDTPEIQQLIRKILESMGIIVVVVDHGQEAVERASTQHFDLILMDMQMPVMDGVEATRVLRGAGDQTPVLALTANVMQKHRDAFRAAGANGFLNKPIDLDQLRRELSRYLEVVEEAEEGGAAPVMET
ncbi:MAG TPA: response regulator, partial [Gammaproteobacteria bacterium]|nr:response regulator [Gammaproteobacteria bacterium]